MLCFASVAMFDFNSSVALLPKELASFSAAKYSFRDFE